MKYSFKGFTFEEILSGKTDKKEIAVEMRRKLDLFGLISLPPLAGHLPREIKSPS